MFYSLDGIRFQPENLFRDVKYGTYNLVIKDRNDCRTTVTAEVKRECGLFVPTAFSPNDDGNNDLFTFFGDASKIDKVLEFKVFSRWGVLMYSDNTVQINNDRTGWNGKIGGTDASTGTYVFYLKVQLKDGTNLEQKGDVTLLR